MVCAVLVPLLAGCAVEGPSSPDTLDWTPLNAADLIRAAIQPCWSINPELPWIAVAIEAQVRRDGTVSSATVVDQDRYRTDPAFRANADRALRAMLNPECQPLPFPADDWPIWSELMVIFDPGPDPFGS